MGIKENFAKNLIKIRKSLGYTQERLGELMGFESIDTVSRYETGKNFPSPENLEKLVSVLNITYDDLLQDVSDKHDQNRNLLDLFELETKSLTGDEQKFILELIRTYKAHIQEKHK